MQIFMLSVPLHAPLDTAANYEALSREMINRGFTAHMVDPQGNKVHLPQGQFVIGVLEAKHTVENITAVARQAAQAATGTEKHNAAFPFHVVCSLVDGLPFVFSA